MKPTLLVLAAGMGSRFGGLKQLETITPNRESIIDFSIFDAVRNGFEKIVFVIREDIEEVFKNFIEKKIQGYIKQKKIKVNYVFQSITDIPMTLPKTYKRIKPWGTGHAIYSARNEITEPFAVINADDFYGLDALFQISTYLQSLPSKSNQFCMVGYRLKNTISEMGTVSRGVSQTSNHQLTGLKEYTKIFKKADKYFAIEENQEIEFTGEEIVSLNLFGFTPLIFESLESQLIQFLQKKNLTENEEFFIPAVVNQLIDEKKASVKVLETSSSWFGITYKEDKKKAIKSIQEMIDKNIYPSPLSF